MTKSIKKSSVIKITGDLTAYGLDDSIVNTYRDLSLRKDYLMYMWNNLIKEFQIPLDVIFDISAKKKVSAKYHINDEDVTIRGNLVSTYTVVIEKFSFNKRESWAQIIFTKHLYSICVDFFCDLNYRIKYVVEKNKCSFIYIYPSNDKIALEFNNNNLIVKILKKELETIYTFSNNKLISFLNKKANIHFYNYTSSNKYKVKSVKMDNYEIAWFFKGATKHIGIVKEDQTREYIVYYGNGNIKTIQSNDIKTGLLTGKYTKYYSNGQIEFTGNYENSSKQGLWIYKNKDGVIKERINWNDDKKEGMCYYYKDGKLIMKKIFENNKCKKRINAT